MKKKIDVVRAVAYRLSIGPTWAANKKLKMKKFSSQDSAAMHLLSIGYQPILSGRWLNGNQPGCIKRIMPCGKAWEIWTLFWR